MKHSFYFILLLPLGLWNCDLAGYEKIKFESNHTERLVYEIDQTGNYTDYLFITKEGFLVGLDIPEEAENINVKLQSVTLSWKSQPENQAESVILSAVVASNRIFAPFSDPNLINREKLILQGSGADLSQLVVDRLLNEGVSLINRITQDFIEKGNTESVIAILIQMLPDTQETRMRTDLILALKYNVSYEVCMPVLLGDGEECL